MMGGLGVDGLLPSTSHCDEAESLSVQRSSVQICRRWPAATASGDIVAGKPGMTNQAVTAMNVGGLHLRVVSPSLNDPG